MKAFWVIRDAITNEKQIRDVVSFAKDHNFNNIFVQVRGRGDAYYDSEIVPKASQISDTDFDPLGEILASAHRAGIRVHAWVNVYLLWSSTRKPGDEEHILVKHPEWTARGFGDMIDAKKKMSMIKRQGIEGVYLSPGHPEADEHLLKVFEELISKYEIDGLHLDYVRYPGAEYGYNPGSADRFREKNGIDPELLVDNYSELIDRLGRENVESYKKQWIEFRLNNISSLVSNIRQMIREVRPGVILSAAVKADPVKAKKRYYQDWTRWISDDLIDFAVPMNYSAALKEYMANLESIMDGRAPEKIIMGIGAFNQNHYAVESKIYKAKAFGIEDFIFFSFAVIKRDPEYLKAIERALSE